MQSDHLGSYVVCGSLWDSPPHEYMVCPLGSRCTISKLAIGHKQTNILCTNTSFDNSQIHKITKNTADSISCSSGDIPVDDRWAPD